MSTHCSRRSVYTARMMLADHESKINKSTQNLRRCLEFSSSSAVFDLFVIIIHACRHINTHTHANQHPFAIKRKETTPSTYNNTKPHTRFDKN